MKNLKKIEKKLKKAIKAVPGEVYMGAFREMHQRDVAYIVLGSENTSTIIVITFGTEEESVDYIKQTVKELGDDLGREGTFASAIIQMEIPTPYGPAQIVATDITHSEKIEGGIN